jgi:hypothetical protein
MKQVHLPEKPSPEWFVVDLLENAAQAGVSRTALATGLARALRQKFNRPRLLEMAKRYGQRATQLFIESAIPSPRT